MSDSRDKPKHQPSPKHTLEEVLRSLQDLVRNELAEDQPPEAKDRPAKKSAPVKSPEKSPEKPPEKLKRSAPPAPPKAAEPSAGIQEELPLAPVPPPANLNWDDIPVLQDVIMAPPLPPSSIDVTPEHAQAIARQMLVKLNQELRAAGQPPLDPVIIPRLAELLREVLEAELRSPAKP